ncbi:MAG: family 14 glycosylhydrolase [Candidatus Omnitrophica bacterium]|nr:family 14 glycosylhydrolase [Candidatus Omnitrophota bacterium]
MPFEVSGGSMLGFLFLFSALSPGYSLEEEKGNLLIEFGHGRPSGVVELLNPDMVREVVRNGEPAIEIERGNDPYKKVEWLFRLKNPLSQEEERLVLEIEFFDEGAGVIQPMLLRDDRFTGEWMRPSRSVSFTRLNTRKVRRALFEFEIPSVDWQNARNPHLKIVGLQYLKSMRLLTVTQDLEWEELAAAVPIEVTPIVKLERPMEITCTVGIEDVGNPPSLSNSLDNIREYAPLAKVLGFTSIECFVRWDMLEPGPGHFDFSHYDQIVEAIQEYGLKWYPNLVITSAFALPGWYFEDASNLGFTCLEHGESNQVPSIWNSRNRDHVTRVLKAFGEHYEPMGVLEAVRLGPSGNFGEAQYPAGAGKSLGHQGISMHAHIGWWAGDAYAQEEFQEFLNERHGSIQTLNQAWETNFVSFQEIKPQLPETYRTSRGRLDMTEWYTDSMTKWCDFWAQEARKAMPKTQIYQSSGGWGYREAGTDFTAQAKSMKGISGGIRLTNETDSFEQNVYATRLAATAARLYGIGLGYEPAGFHSARGVVARFFSTASTNGSNLYTRHSVLFNDDYAVENWLRYYHLLDLRQSPVIDVAVYYPETMNQLDDGTFRHLYAWGFNSRAAEVRRRVDVDYLDERLIREGFLDRYSVLVFCWGKVIPSDVEQIVDRWLRAGGTVIFPSYPRGPYETVEGDTSVFLSWERGDTGDGSFFRFPGDMEPISLYGDFIEGVLKEVPQLHPWTKQAMKIQHPPRVFFSILEDGQVLALNYSDESARILLKEESSEVLPPFSIKVLALPLFTE